MSDSLLAGLDLVSLAVIVCFTLMILIRALLMSAPCETPDVDSARSLGTAITTINSDQMRKKWLKKHENLFMKDEEHQESADHRHSTEQKHWKQEPFYEDKDNMSEQTLGSSSSKSKSFTTEIDKMPYIFNARPRKKMSDEKKQTYGSSFDTEDILGVTDCLLNRKSCPGMYTSALKDDEAIPGMLPLSKLKESGLSDSTSAEEIQNEGTETISESSSIFPTISNHSLKKDPSSKFLSYETQAYPRQGKNPKKNVDLPLDHMSRRTLQEKALDKNYLILSEFVKQQAEKRWSPLSETYLSNVFGSSDTSKIRKNASLIQVTEKDTSTPYKTLLHELEEKRTVEAPTRDATLGSVANTDHKLWGPRFRFHPPSFRKAKSFQAGKPARVKTDASLTVSGSKGHSGATAARKSNVPLAPLSKFEYKPKKIPKVTHPMRVQGSVNKEGNTSKGKANVAGDIAGRLIIITDKPSSMEKH